MTGGIGSGKSRVASLLGRLLTGIVISADDVCRELLEAGREGYLQFVRSGGTQFLDGDGVINRVKLREKIFADPALRDQLEAILHPLVLERIQAVAEDAPDSFVIAEVPLLFERGWQDQFDTIIAVSAPQDVVVQRVVDRQLDERPDGGGGLLPHGSGLGQRGIESENGDQDAGHRQDGLPEGEPHDVVLGARQGQSGRCVVGVIGIGFPDIVGHSRRLDSLHT